MQASRTDTSRAEARGPADHQCDVTDGGNRRADGPSRAEGLSHWTALGARGKSALKKITILAERVGQLPDNHNRLQSQALNSGLLGKW